MENTEIVSQSHETDEYTQILLNTGYDAEAWVNLIQEAQHSHNEVIIRKTFISALERYPLSGRLLSEYVEFELGTGNREKAETIFNEKLFVAPSLELWKCYLSYVLKTNQDSQNRITLPESRTVVMNCYKLVLENVGGDRDSGQIWLDFIDFLNSGETFAQYEEQMKVSQIREAYQQAVAIPMLKVEEVWKNYDSFENNINRTSAKRYLSELSSSYMTARTALREMNKFWDEIQKNHTQFGLPKYPEWSPREINYLQAWKKYISWEISNPLKTEDQAQMQKRIEYAYNQANMALRFYPEIWIEFSDWLWTSGRREEALAKICDASKVLENNLSVSFAYVEMAEYLRQLQVCKHVYEKLVEKSRSAIDAVQAKYSQRLERLRQNSEGGTTDPSDLKEDNGESAELPEALDFSSDSSLAGSDVSSNDGDYDENEGISRRDESNLEASNIQIKKLQTKSAIEKQIEKVRNRMDVKLDRLREEHTLIWIMYLRFVRRSEGIEAARQLLRRPRSDPQGYVTYHLFVAAALMEYHVGRRPDIAGRLFEYYSKNYSEDTDYIIQYMDHLISTNDDSNVRALFERFHGQNAGNSKQLWDLFADYEYNYGNLSSISKFDKRYIDKFPDETAITRLAAKYSYLDLDIVSAGDFGFDRRYSVRNDGVAGQLHGRHFDQSYGDDADGNSGEMPATSAFSGIDHHGEHQTVTVGSVTGRFLSKRQLMKPVHSSKFVKPTIADLESYRPKIEPLAGVTSTDQITEAPHVIGQSGLVVSSTGKGRSLENGDVLSYIINTVSSSESDNFEGRSIDPGLLLETIMDLALPDPTVQSDLKLLNSNEVNYDEYGNPIQPYDSGNTRRNKHPLPSGYRSRSQSKGHGGPGDNPPGYRPYGNRFKHMRGRRFQNPSPSYRHMPYNRHGYEGKYSGSLPYKSRYPSTYGEYSGSKRGHRGSYTG